MREIKFRVWNEISEMLYPDGNGYFDDGKIFVIDGLGELIYLDDNSTPNGILMQYTGLKDKNGKEIYEGDIILCDYEKIVVSYGIQGVDAFEGIGYNLWSHYGQKQDGTRLQSEVKVIGNIYENSKLLKN